MQGDEIRILIIDDNPSIHEDFRKVLASPKVSRELDEMEALLFGGAGAAASEVVSAGFAIQSAHQGEEGVALVRQAAAAGLPFAVAFVDVRMPPGIDGIEAAARIWEVDPDLQIVLCTAYSDYSWEQTVHRLGQLDRWLIQKKPFDNIEVRQLAHALSTKWALARRVRAQLTELEARVVERTAALNEINQQLKREIQERQRVEVELRHAQKLEAIGQLAAGVAHEINTPIQFVGDSAHFVRDACADLLDLIAGYRAQCAAPTGALPDPLRRLEEAADLAYLREQVPIACERTLDGVERVASIVRALKEFAHIGQKEQAPADLNRALQGTLVVARNEYKYIADVTTELGELPAVVCNLGDVNQVFLNLVVNAAHAIQDRIQGGAERGEIRVSSRREGDGVLIAIADTGCGIPEAVRPRIFEPFFTTKEVGRGTGQGLAIARSIVDRHGGALTFESAEGRGTTFFVRLPIDGCPGPESRRRQS